MSKILVIAGTSDGKDMINLLLDADYEVIATTATEYGGSVLPKRVGLSVVSDRLTDIGFFDLIESESPDAVVDMSHPFAVVVSETVAKVASNLMIPYIQYVRPKEVYQYDKINYVYSYDDVIACLNQFDGNIFLTVGSNNLSKFMDVTDYKNRIYVRVLNTASSISCCRSIGLTDSHIFTMTTVPTKEDNLKILNEINSVVLVTKDSGKKGGVMEKIAAAKEINIPVIMIKRTNTSGYHRYDEILRALKEVING